MSPREGEIQTTTAGGLWGAYLITIAHFCKELASKELAEPRAIKSVNMSSNLNSRKLNCVTVSHFHTRCLQTDRFKRSPLSVTPREGEMRTTTAGGLWGAYLMTIARFHNELATQELAKPRATKSVRLSSVLTYRRLKAVTASHFCK